MTKVAAQGVPGAYSEQAASRLFYEPYLEFMPQFEDVFRAVQNKTHAYGILPVENTIGGAVELVHSLLKDYNVKVKHEITIPIHHVLLAKENIAVECIRAVYSHEQALRQCSNFIAQNLAITPMEMANTAAAARYVSKSCSKDIAAIASRESAKLYGLTVIAGDIQNEKENFTKFICIEKGEF